MQDIVTPDFTYLPLTAINIMYVVYSLLLPLSRSAVLSTTTTTVDVEYTLPILS